MAALGVAVCRFRGACCSLVSSWCSSRRLVVTKKTFSSKTWGESDSETEMEEEESLSEITRKLKNQQKAILFQRMKRQMEPRGPPERRLTWNAIEEIRYLKQEFPDEWTVPRLAEGFNVSTDVIRRIIKSKLSPPERRKAKQDIKVSNVLIQPNKQSTKHLSQPTQTLLLGALNPAQALIPSGQNDKLKINTQTSDLVLSPGSLPASANRNSLLLRSENEMMQRNKANLQVCTKKAQVQTPKSAMYDVGPTSEEGSQAEQQHCVDDKQMELDEWDGQLLSDTDLEELSRSGIENKMKVIQRGREFFDSNGDFLYRI
ncbi:hypothetical protein XENTR_v10020766 [Xenopus tropicalis]|uniref:Neugrin n=1 Tax=Xenopus tropicalis TaxID=8364 RepID=B3DM15_XENTR|nr:neugrin [Xenopus tropicalis]AAI67664.1 LOC779519 protein [Xenopus tropicalis]KAE8583973.1 hypothetical protein XENTR_v10020766 [Xenopus tropicalis]|eukprot:NP_001122120.1 neugrin [Xenopus tropicalis]